MTDGLILLRKNVPDTLILLDLLFKIMDICLYGKVELDKLVHLVNNRFIN